MKKVLIVIGCIVVVAGIGIAAATLILGNTADAAYYSLGKDRVASIKEAVGKRDVTSVSTATSNGVLTKTMVYKTDLEDVSQAAEDLAVYFNYLIEKEGFLSMVEFDGLPYAGGVDLRLGKRSVDEGKIIILDITYDSTGYTLVFTKGEGEFTKN